MDALLLAPSGKLMKQLRGGIWMCTGHGWEEQGDPVCLWTHQASSSETIWSQNPSPILKYVGTPKRFGLYGLY